MPQQRFTELIEELATLGTRAIRFSGGGEPLFHRKIRDVLRTIIASGIPIENLTTNAVLLDEEIAGLLTQCCDQVTVSLNTDERCRAEKTLDVATIRRMDLHVIRPP